MKYYSLTDIEEMKANGYEKMTIDDAVAIQEKADALINDIEKAFEDVKLEDGVGLREGQGLDGREDKKTLNKIRKIDEKDDWKSIPVKELNECHSSLSFFDAKGIRFHLPAFMIAQIRCEFDQEVVFTLTNLSDYGTEQMEVLSREQKNVIIKVLEYLAVDNDYDFDRPAIKRSIDEYWSH